MGHANISRITKSTQRDGAPEAALLEELRDARDGAERRLELVQRVLLQRDELAQQVDAIRELSERLIEESERKQQEIVKLEGALEARSGRIGELEEKLQWQAARIQELQRTLKMLADAEEKAT